MSKKKDIKAVVKKHLVPWRVYGGVVFLPEMQEFSGKKVNVYDGAENMVLVRENAFVWTNEMLDFETEVEENETETVTEEQEEE